MKQNTENSGQYSGTVQCRSQGTSKQGAQDICRAGYTCTRITRGRIVVGTPCSFRRKAYIIKYTTNNSIPGKLHSARVSGRTTTTPLTTTTTHTQPHCDDNSPALPSRGGTKHGAPLGTQDTDTEGMIKGRAPRGSHSRTHD